MDAGRLAELGWFDGLGLFLLAGGTLLGFWRGLWWQVVRLLGLLGAIALARTMTPLAHPALAEVFPSLPDRLGHGLTWFGLFVAGLVAASLLGLIGKKSLDVLKLGLADRLGGALAGLLSGAAVQLAIVVGLLHFAPRPLANATLDGTHSAQLFADMSARLPLVVDEATARHLRPWLERSGEAEPGDWLSRELRAAETASEAVPRGVVR